MTSISKAILSLIPGAIFSIEDNDYNKIIWSEKNSEELPSLETILFEVERLSKLEELNEYKKLRQYDYPKIDELVIALWENIVEGKTENMDELQKIREIIKNKYPKPEV